MSLTFSHFLYWLAAYLIGSIPWGWLFVWFVKHKDIRYIASGRMGMSNVLRTAGPFWGILTAILDILKGSAAVWAAYLFVSEPEPWMKAIGGVLAVLGHIYSVFLIEKRRNGKYYFRGGAGGLTSCGAGVVFWPLGYWIAVPLPCLIIYLFSGYASITTALFNVFAMIGYIVGIALGKCSWWYVFYAVCAEILVLLSLRPNFKRLKRGDERKSSLRIRWRKEDRENKEAAEKAGGAKQQP